jgi:L-ribulose-5-phosphate 3-epimerase
MDIAAITDEFSPDLAIALPAMRECGMTGVELRTVGGRNIVDLSDGEVEAVREAVRGFEVVSIASPLLKCVLPGGPEIDRRFEHDVFASAHTFDDQTRIAQRAMAVAQMLGAPVIRVFSYWRTVEPSLCFEGVASALRGLADDAAKRDLIIGLENEHACNVGTASEAAAILNAVRHPNLRLVWDPANALVAGERDGYALLPGDRIVHVHAKDWRSGWCSLGEGDVGWPRQIAALQADGYAGWISLETHWAGPNGDKLEASRICGRHLRSMVKVHWSGSFSGL